MQNNLYIPIDTTIYDPVECEKLVKRGDTITLTVKVFANGILADLTGQTVDLILKKADGTVIQHTLDTSNISGGVITAQLEQQATVVAGPVNGEFQIYTTGTLTSTNTFTFNVSTSLADNVIEVSQNDISVLNDLRQTIANGEAEILQYKDHILAIANSIEAIEALENIKSYIDTNLPALQNANSQAVINIANERTANTELQKTIVIGTELTERLEYDISIGNILDSNLKQDISIGNILNANLLTNIANGNNVILQLKNANWDYITSMFNILEVMINGSIVTDENRNYFTDENGNYLTM